ncbi:MAG TPA: translation elongation factor Ts [Planctomycetota bacterium]|nr:translation elongation factor Ts [Planctomycetota bacterium]
MAEINAQIVGKLREKTGQRLMDCKKALTETGADAGKGEGAWIESAEAWLRKKGLDKGGAMAEKSATEGLLGHKVSNGGRTLTVVEMTASTDFSARNAEFAKLLNELVELADAKKIDSVEALNAQTIGGASVADTVKALAGKIGENIGIKRVVRYDGDIGFYIHHDNKQGAVVELGGVTGEKAAAIGKDIAMHIVFAKPTYLTRDQVSPEAVKKENEIALEKLKSDPKNASKPQNILEKIIQGQIGKFYAGIVLPDQEYYKDGSKTVAKVLAENGATVKRFTRFEVGVI